MPLIVRVLTVTLIVAEGLAQSGMPTPTSNSRAFWLDVAKNQYAVPAGQPLPGLVSELSGYLGSPDPELRDDIAYSTLSSWIYRQRIVPVELRRALIAQWTANMTIGIGDRSADSVFRRSFSALSLGILAILDNEAPYLERVEFDRLLNAGLAYLIGEEDVRGFDEAKGWMHSVAHTADLLKFLARSRHLQVAQQAQILEAIRRKLAGLDTVLIHGEDDRLARAVVSIAARKDFDEPGFRAWVANINAPASAAPPTLSSLANARNRINLVVSLLAALSTDTRALAPLESARAIVLTEMKGG